MVMTTVLAECPTCEKEREVKIIDCDECFENYVAFGGDPDKYSDLQCEHLQCLTCGERLL